MLVFGVVPMRIAREGGDVPNDQHSTQRILSNLRAHELEGEINIGGLLILGPFVQVTRREDNVVQEPSALSEVGLEPRLVQVLGAGLHNILLIIFDAGKVLIDWPERQENSVLTPSTASAAGRGGTPGRGSCAH